jgi:hypothetical protein
MTEALAALTKLVKVVMSYRPDRAKKPKPKRRAHPPKAVQPRK